MKHKYVWKEVVERTLYTLNETYACIERSCSTNTWYFKWNICMYGKKLLNDHLILYVKHTHVWKEVVQRTLNTLNETYACVERSCWTYTWYFKWNIRMCGKKLFNEHLILWMKHTHVWKEVVQRTLDNLNETYACMERSFSTNTWYFKWNIGMYG